MSYPTGQDGTGQEPYPLAGHPQQHYPPQHHPQQSYGYPAPYPGQAFAPTPGNGLGVAGFVTGLLGLILCWVPFFGLVLGVLGLVLGGAGISSGRRSGAGTGLAIAGLVLGVISLVPAVLVIAALSSV